MPYSGDLGEDVNSISSCLWDAISLYVFTVVSMSMPLSGLALHLK